MDRRHFLRTIVLGSAGYSLTLPPVFPSEAVAATGGRPLLSSVTGSDYRLIVIEAVRLLGGMSAFVKPGSRVVVKPNIGWDRKPEQGANTHPVVVKTIVEMALEAGAKEVRVFDHTCNEKRRCYINSGMTEAIESLRSKQAKLVHIDQRKFVSVDIKKGRSLTRWDIYKDVLTADSYINVPVAKHHGLSRLTLGLKNSMGVIGGSRGRLHHDLGQKLADLATVVSPALTVIDATRMLMNNGPQGGNLKDVRQQDTVIASADPVAADAFASTLFGLKPQDLSSTVAAHRMGLGQMDLSQIELRKQNL